MGTASAAAARNSREERPEAVGDRDRSGDERIDVVERGAQVHEGCVGLAQEVGKLVDRVGQLLALAPDRAQGIRSVDDELAQIVAALGQKRRKGGGVDDQGLEAFRVAVELSEDPA